MSKTNEVILPEELLLNSLLLFEDEVPEDEISDLQDREESDHTQLLEKTGSLNTPGPIVTIVDANIDINKASLDLEKQDTQSHYLKVRKELAHYLRERQNIVEEVRKKLLAKAKSSEHRNCLESVKLKPPTKFYFKLSEPNSGFNPRGIPKKEENIKLISPKESSIRSSDIKKGNRIKKTFIKGNNKEKNYLTIENWVSPESKTKKNVKSQKVKISKINDQRTVSVNILRLKPENQRRVVVNNSLKNLELNNNPPERILSEKISPARSHISNKLSIKNKLSLSLSINEEKQIKRITKEKTLPIQQSDLQINDIKQNSVKDPSVNRLNHSLINKGSLNRGDRVHIGGKENKMSMKDLDWGKKDLEFKQLSFSEDKRNFGYIFKM